MASKWFFPTAHADQSNQPEAEPITGVHGEEPDEPEDPRTEIVQECEEKKCASVKHHLDECSRRVEEGSSENCVEEMFHLIHCVDPCVAPKLFSKLK